MTHQRSSVILNHALRKAEADHIQRAKDESHWMKSLKRMEDAVRVELQKMEGALTVSGVLRVNFRESPDFVATLWVGDRLAASFQVKSYTVDLTASDAACDVSVRNACLVVLIYAPSEFSYRAVTCCSETHLVEFFEAVGEYLAVWFKS